MSDIKWESPYCGEAANCYRFGTDDRGNSYIALAGTEERFLMDTREALQQMIRDIKDGKADHLL